MAMLTPWEATTVRFSSQNCISLRKPIPFSPGTRTTSRVGTAVSDARISSLPATLSASRLSGSASRFTSWSRRSPARPRSAPPPRYIASRTLLGGVLSVVVETLGTSDPVSGSCRRARDAQPDAGIDSEQFLGDRPHLERRVAGAAALDGDGPAPLSPIFAASSITSWGYDSSTSWGVATGAISSSAKRRTSSRIIRCSSVRPKSMLYVSAPADKYIYNPI